MRQSRLTLLAAVGWISASSYTVFLVNAFVLPPASPQRRSHRLNSNKSPVIRLTKSQSQSSPSSSPLDQTHVQSLWVFVHNLQRERREHRIPTAATTSSAAKTVAPKTPRSSKSTSPEYSTSIAANNQVPSVPNTEKRRRNPAKSLVNFLSKNKFHLEEDGEDAFHNNTNFQQQHHQQQHQQAPEEVEPFSRAVVQAIRLASESGDYKLIIHLVEASIQYANAHPIIMPRVFGEAIDGISKTSANMAKIKQLWNLGTSPESKVFLTEPLGTFELNVMIKAIASRGKIKAALSLYHDCTQQQPSSIIGQGPTILPDSYTLSSIFLALQDSITDDQPTARIRKSSNSTDQTDGNADSESEAYFQKSSQCWQWNSAMNILTSYSMGATTGSNRHDPSLSNTTQLPPLNNHVFASLLKLNERVSEVYPSTVHNGPRMVLYLLNTMHQLDISPDVVTCTLIISNLGYQWKTAVNLLFAMKTTPHATSGSASSSMWKLPRPNVYTYSAVITICAHCHQYEVAMELLEEMKQDDALDSPNTWVYNAALLATTRSDSLAVLASQQEKQQEQQHGHRTAPKQKRSQERLLMAIKLLREMQGETNINVRPDTVTYNTVLATLDGIAGPSEIGAESALGGIQTKISALFRHKLQANDIDELSLEELAVHSLMDEMENSGILRDSITYRNALLAVRFSSDIRRSVWRLLDRAILDNEALGLTSTGALDIGRKQVKTYKDSIPARRQLAGKAANGVTFVFDTAMTILASRGDVQGVLLTFDKMMGHAATSSRTETPSEQISAAQIHFVHALGNSATSESPLIPIFLNALKNDNIAKLAIRKDYPTIDKRLFLDNTSSESLFSAAISACLVASDIEKAREVLSMMKAEGLKPSELSLQEIARTYARLAVVAADEEGRHTPRGHAGAKNEDNSLSDSGVVTLSGEEATLATMRAQNAFRIATMALADPPASLLSTIARTCASLGMWKEASKVLRMLHRRIPPELGDISSIGSIGAARAVLPGVHRALLRAASIQGNVTAALWYAEDIQELSRRIAESTATQNNEDLDPLSQLGDESLLRKNSSPLLSAGIPLEPYGMQGEDWKLLIIAASKCGHWRVCVNTLQFLRPFLEATHPSSLGITVEERSRRYGHLAPALTVAIKCLEIRSQYGWAVRAIDDWMEWSGRRPPKAAVLAAIRVLSARGRGDEVLSLLARCALDGGAALVSYPNVDENYEMVLYVGAITALHNEGLYDDADDAFIAAVNGKFLPFDLNNQALEDGKQRIVLDLHGMNVPVAHSAVRVALQQEVETASWNSNQSTSSDSDGGDDDSAMVIVTGRGRNSALRMRPVLRPEVQRMLLEEFYPPLSTTSIPGNMGAVRIPSTDISAWLRHQRKQKGSRMLAVASVLRNLSSVDRLRQSIALKLQAEEDAKLQNEKSEEPE